MTNRIVRASAVLAAGVLVLVPAAAARAPAAPPPGSTGEAVTAALVEAAGSVAVVDHSTHCMAASPEPVAYRTDRIVLRTGMPAADAEGLVQAALPSVGSAADVTGSETIRITDDDAVTPVVAVSFEPPAGETVPIVDLARRLRQHPVPASPDYLLSPSDGPSEWWPGGPPEPIAASQLQPPRHAGWGSGVTIAAYDVGLPSPLEGNWPPNVQRLTPADVEILDAREPFGEVDLYSKGHTLPIASIIATLAPSATVVAARTTDLVGVGTDVSAARRMAGSLRKITPHFWPELLVNAFGSPACDAGPPTPGADMPPLGLQMVAEVVDRSGESLIVASAGNRSSPRPHYPAAFQGVLAVGALDTTADSDGNAWTAPSRSGPPAHFSNYGDWVDAWAPGVDLSSTHVNGYSYEGGQTVNGYASVDGTSFAAPYVAGLLAEQIAVTGLSPEQAWDDIESHGVQCAGGVATGTAVALTTMNSTATTPPAAGELPAC